MAHKATESPSKKGSKCASISAEVETAGYYPKRTPKACDRCRMKKARCSAGEPPCAKCKRDGVLCVTASEDTRFSKLRQSPEYIRMVESQRDLLVSAVRRLWNVLPEGNKKQLGEFEINRIMEEIQNFDHGRLDGEQFPLASSPLLVEEPRSERRVSRADTSANLTTSDSMSTPTSGLHQSQQQYPAAAFFSAFSSLHQLSSDPTPEMSALLEATQVEIYQRQASLQTEGGPENYMWLNSGGTNSYPDTIAYDQVSSPLIDCSDLLHPLLKLTVT